MSYLCMLGAYLVLAADEHSNIAVAEEQKLPPSHAISLRRGEYVDFSLGENFTSPAQQFPLTQVPQAPHHIQVYIITSTHLNNPPQDPSLISSTVCFYYQGIAVDDQRLLYRELGPPILPARYTIPVLL